MKKIITTLIIISLSLFVLSGCGSQDKVNVGDLISITYTATYSDGTMFDQNSAQAPLMFVVGSGQVIQGLEEGILGMKVGKTRTITITPDKWFGKLYQEANIQKVGKLIFDKIGIVPEKWKMQKLDTIEWFIRGFETDTSGNEIVLFDINPRQTWDTLKYKVTILAIEQK